MQDLILALWGLLNIQFNFMGYTFSLFNVIEGGIVLFIFGFAFGKIILFTENKR